MAVTVSGLGFAPVKGMRLQSASEIQVGPHGVAGDREFLVIRPDGALAQTGQTPSLVQVEPAWDPARDRLTLAFPGGDVVSGSAEAGPPAATRMYDGRELPGRVVTGPLSAALSEYLGQAVNLFRRAPDQIGTDDQPVTLMSGASLQALAAEFGGAAPDPRRFRMNITITGAAPWAEHAWSGRQVTIGGVTLRIVAPVPRCVVTTRNPESGATDARVLHALARIRGKDDVTFGVWCETLRPGRIQVGDVLIPPPGG